MNKLKQSFIIITIMLLVTACEFQDVNQGNEPALNQAAVGKIAVHEDAGAAFLAEQFKANGVNMRTSGIASNAFDSVVYYFDAQSGLRNYSFLLSGDNVEEVSNLVFIQTDSAYIGYEVVYEPSSSHLNNLDLYSFLADFSGIVKYKSLQTGEPFVEMQYENGVALAQGSSGGRTSDANCYPDEGAKINCYVNYSSYTERTRVYQTVNPHTHKKEWVYKEGQTVTQTEIYCEVDKDFSTCHLTYFNTGGYTTFPQWYGGYTSGTLVNPNQFVEPVFEPINLNEVRIKNLVAANPFALLDVPCDQLPKWQTLAQHKPSQVVIDRLKNLDENYTSILSGDWDIQYIEDASGPVVNMDYFPVTITKFPNDPTTGQQYTTENFYNHVRKNLNSFFDGNPTVFSPYNAAEGAIWDSNNYLGAIMRFDIEAFLGGVIPGQQDGSVICSYQSTTTWRFTTIESPMDWNHPVSGTREFGLTANADGTYSFYVRGIDRVAESFDDFAGSLPNTQSAFDGADALWTQFQSNLESFINNPVNGGVAQKALPVIFRPNWENVKKVLSGKAPISSLGCK